MSVQAELDRLSGAKSAIAAAITDKGVTVPDGTMLDGMAALIAAIEAGGGIDGVDYFETGTITPSEDISDSAHNIEFGYSEYNHYMKEMFIMYADPVMTFPGASASVSEVGVIFIVSNWYSSTGATTTTLSFSRYYNSTGKLTTGTTASAIGSISFVSGATSGNRAAVLVLNTSNLKAGKRYRWIYWARRPVIGA